MTDVALATLGTLPKCPHWCTEDRINEVNDSICHIQRSQASNRGWLVMVTQVDEPAVHHIPPTWDRRDASITLVAEGLPKFDVHNLTPDQAFGIAELIAEHKNDDLAFAILDAAVLLKPELVR